MTRIFPLVCAVLLSIPAVAAEFAGTVKAVQGDVRIDHDGNARAAVVGDKVYAKDRLTTGTDGRVSVTLRDDTLLSTGPNGRLTINEFEFNPSTHGGQVFLSVARGVTAMVSGLIAKADPKAMRVTTPTATIGIRGTEFVVEVADD